MQCYVLNPCSAMFGNFSVAWDQ